MTFPFSPATTLSRSSTSSTAFVPGFLATETVTAAVSAPAATPRWAAPGPAIIQTYCEGSSAPSETDATSRRKTGLPFQTATTAPPTSSALRKREPTSTWVSASAVAKLPAGRRQFAPDSAM